MRRYIIDEHGVIVFLGRPKASQQKKTRDGKLRQLTSCPVCHVSLKPGRLKTHLSKVHQQVLPQDQIAVSGRKSQQSHAGDRTRDASRTVASSTEERVTGIDPRDGGKYLGHMAREAGRFGSLPLFDNYGDESDPE